MTDLGDISSAASLILQASEVADFLNSVEQKLETGAVTDAKKQIDQNLPTRLHKLKSMLTERANALKTNLDRGGTWPETDRDGVLDDAKTKVTTFLTTHGDRNANAVDLGGSLRDFDLLIRLLRPRLADFRAEAIRKLSSKVRDGLVDIPVVTKSAQTANLTRAIEEFEKAAGAANGTELFKTLMRKEEELRDELAAALGFASKSVQQPKDKPDGLDAHRYREAMNDVRVREGLGALGKPGAPVTPSGAVPLPPDADDVMGAKRFGHFRIISRSEIRVGTPTVFAVDPIQPLGGPTVDDMNVAWWINGKAIESSGNSGMNCRYTANASERELEVRVRITAQGANVQVDQEVTKRFLVMQHVGRDLARCFRGGSGQDRRRPDSHRRRINHARRLFDFSGRFCRLARGCDRRIVLGFRCRCDSRKGARIRGTVTGTATEVPSGRLIAGVSRVPPKRGSPATLIMTLSGYSAIDDKLVAGATL